MIQIKLTSDKSKIPSKGSKDAAGYDLYSIDDTTTTLQSLERRLFKTGINIKIPTGYYGRIAPRSGLALNNGIDVMGGICDSDYLGDIGVILLNTSNIPVTIDTTKAIAQLIIEKHYDMEFSKVSELDVTDRGTDGFGSTDNKPPKETITRSESIDAVTLPGLMPTNKMFNNGFKQNNLIQVKRQEDSPITTRPPYKVLEEAEKRYKEDSRYEDTAQSNRDLMMDRYEKMGGIVTKKKYSEEMKEHQDQ